MSAVILNPKAEHFAKFSTFQTKHIEAFKDSIGGFLSNNKPNADQFLKILAEKFVEVYGPADHLIVEKKNPSYPAPPELIEEISQNCNFAVCVMGD